MKRTTLSLVLSCLFSASVFAGVSSDMSGFYESLGYSAKVNNPSSYKGQEADYYSAGSLTVKSRVRDSNLFQITMPDIKAGCGGIDLFAGGFSHISSDQLSNMGKAIISDAAPFAVKLALQTWAPEIENIMGDLQTVADEFNKLSVNSCQASQDAVSGLWPFKNENSQKFICNTLGTQSNKFSDWAAGMNDCGKAGTANDMANKASQDPKLKDLTKKNQNIVWSQLQKQEFLKKDSELAEFFMSLSGTIIYDKDGNEHTLPSLVSHNNNLIDAVMNGGKIHMYRCQDHKLCLAPRKQEFTLDKNSALQAMVFKMISSLVTAVENDQAISDSQQSFLEETDLPILKFITTSVQVGQAPDTAAYAQVMAKDFTRRYLQDILQTVQFALSNAENDKDDLEKLTNGIYQAQSFLADLHNDAEERLLFEQKLIQSSQEQQRAIEGNFSSRMKSAMSFGDE